MGSPTLTIGIPAHNEARNIANLLRAVLAQRQESFRLESVVVVCDGCTDRTARIVGEFRQAYPCVKLLDVRQHRGKAFALNKLYSTSTSDFLLTLDADILPERDIEIEQLFRAMVKHYDVNAVGGRFVPVKPKTFMGRCSYVSFLSFEDAILKLHGGDNMFALIGAASLIRKRLYKSFRYPRGTISDQNYLYVMATLNNPEGFKLATNSCFFIRTVGTFHDWRILGSRSVRTDRENVANFFGKEILDEYYMPRILLFSSLLKWAMKDPIGTVGSLCMNMFIRMFPYDQANVQDGRWEMTSSSKDAILLNVNGSGEFHLVFFRSLHRLVSVLIGNLRLLLKPYAPKSVIRPSV